MATSPPYRSPAASPPNPAHSALPNPRKRGAGPISASSLHNKRRKPASFSASSSSHPLRQTSFPPEEAFAQGVRSPSVDSDYTAITAGDSVAASATGGKRGGKGKGRGSASVVSGNRGGALDDGKSKAGPAEEEEDGEEEEGDDDNLVDEGTKNDDKRADNRKLAVLMDAFSPEQNERYIEFRRAKLKKETVRKIVNQTLSQSVPPSVVTTINGYTKVFVGTIIERARVLQKQQHDAARSLPSPLPSGSQQTSQTATVQGSQSTDVPTDDDYLGPLLPDHIREAFRRYRKDGEGGGAGVGGYSVGLGQSGGGSARLGGRRLFR